MILCETVFDRYVLTFDIAGLLQALAKRGQKLRVIAARPAGEESYHWHCRLLRAHGERPQGRRAPENSDELTSPHLSPKDLMRGSSA
jgi:hypothetical protein